MGVVFRDPCEEVVIFRLLAAAGSHGYTMKDEPLPSTLSENRKHRLRANNRNLSQCLAAGNSGDRLVTAFQSYLFSRQFCSRGPFGDSGVVNS